MTDIWKRDSMYMCCTCGEHFTSTWYMGTLSLSEGGILHMACSLHHEASTPTAKGAWALYDFISVHTVSSMCVFVVREDSGDGADIIQKMAHHTCQLDQP
jgi:hypothetical protein